MPISWGVGDSAIEVYPLRPKSLGIYPKSELPLSAAVFTLFNALIGLTWFPDAVAAFSFPCLRADDVPAMVEPWPRCLLTDLYPLVASTPRLSPWICCLGWRIAPSPWSSNGWVHPALLLSRPASTQGQSCLAPPLSSFRCHVGGPGSLSGSHSA